MAKKKVKKVKAVENGMLGDKSTNTAFENLWIAMAKLEQRIDRIVEAIDKSRKVKGL